MSKKVKAGDVLKLGVNDMVAHVVGSSEDKRHCWKKFWESKAGGASLILVLSHFHIRLQSMFSF